MKKKILALVLAIGTLLSASASVYAERPIRIKVGGEILETDVAPVVIDGRVMLPVRAVFEAIDAEVDYVAEEQKVVATKKDTTAIFVIDSNVMTVNGAEKEIDVPATVIDGRTMVPVRACAEAFDLKVEWNGNTKTVKVKKETSLLVEEKEGDLIIKYQYDQEGNMIYEEHSDGYWIQYEYDENGNEIYEKDSDGGWWEYTYDENGNRVHETNSNGYWNRAEYDEDGKMTYKKAYYPVLGSFSYVYEYDEKGRIVSIDKNDLMFKQYVYEENGDVTIITVQGDSRQEEKFDANGNLVFYSTGADHWQQYVYDERGNQTKYSNSSGTVVKYENTYDANGNLIRREDTDGYWVRYEYDENGNEIYEKDSDGGWWEYTYDENGNLIYMESETFWSKREYYASGNLIYQESSGYTGDADGSYKKYIVMEI